MVPNPEHFLIDFSSDRIESQKGSLDPFSLGNLRPAPDNEKLGCGAGHSPHFPSLHWYWVNTPVHAPCVIWKPYFLIALRLHSVYCWVLELTVSSLVIILDFFWSQARHPLGCPRRSVWSVCPHEHWGWEESGFKSSSAVGIIHVANVKSGNTWSGQ